MFPSPTGLLPRHRALEALLRKLSISAAPNGLRSSFRDWAAGSTEEAPRKLYEVALTVINNDRVEPAYRRSDLFDGRRELMPQWGDCNASRN